MNDEKTLTPEQVVTIARVMSTYGSSTNELARAFQELGRAIAKSNKVISAMYDRLHTDECTCSVHSVMKRPPPKLI